MGRIQKFASVLVVTSSIALVGAYVWHRGSVAAQEGPQTGLPSQDAGRSMVVMAGSKSGVIGLEASDPFSLYLPAIQIADSPDGVSIPLPQLVASDDGFVSTIPLAPTLGFTVSLPRLKVQRSFNSYFPFPKPIRQTQSPFGGNLPVTSFIEDFALGSISNPWVANPPNTLLLHPTNSSTFPIVEHQSNAKFPDPATLGPKLGEIENVRAWKAHSLTDARISSVLRSVASRQPISVRPMEVPKEMRGGIAPGAIDLVPAWKSNTWDSAMRNPRLGPPISTQSTVAPPPTVPP